MIPIRPPKAGQLTRLPDPVVPRPQVGAALIRLRAEYAALGYPALYRASSLPMKVQVQWVEALLPWHVVLADGRSVRCESERRYAEAIARSLCLENDDDGYAHVRYRHVEPPSETLPTFDPLPVDQGTVVWYRGCRP